MSQLLFAAYIKRNSEVEAKPFLRWAGSKKKILPKLLEYWRSDHTRYIEPFMGSACLFFEINPPQAILSDINNELIDAFTSIKNHPLSVFKSLSMLPIGEGSYYNIRAIEPSSLNKIDRAARFIYLNRFCFNGLYRTNLKGEFNVPYGAARSGNLPTIDKLISVSKCLKSTVIKRCDFEDTISVARKGDFIYMDPPFALSNRRVFRQYGPNSFGTEDIARLADSMRQIDRKGATFLVSYAMCKEALESFKEWDIHRVFTQRNISGFSNNRRKSIELLISNGR